jgi:Mlc titration factor MtfA (ptsG expression regulator)
MERPVLNKVFLDNVILGLLSGMPSVTVTMGQGQWDKFLQAAYDAGHFLIEVDDCETPVRAYHKRPDA